MTQTVDMMLTIADKLEKVTLPVYEMEDYRIRPMRLEDFPAVASFSDPSLEETLNESTLRSLCEVGYSFEADQKGIVGFVGELKETGEIVGRGYVKTWHSTNFQFNIYAQTPTGGIEVVNVLTILNQPTRIAELGGLLVKPDHRRKGLSSALVYAILDFIVHAGREFGYGADAVVTANVGPLRPSDNQNRVNYLEKLLITLQRKGYIEKPERSELAKIAHRGEVLTRAEVQQIFYGLTVTIRDGDSYKEVPYFFGAPRQASLPAYLITQKILRRAPLMRLNQVEYVSPIIFETDKQYMFSNHGGSFNYAINTSESSS